MKNFISFIMKYILFTLLFIHLSLTTIGQVHTLPNLLTDEIIMSAALLPDSSLMIVAEKQDKSEVRRYTYQNKQWTLSPDELSATINRLSAGHKHFRFSPD